MEVQDLHASMDGGAQVFARTLGFEPPQGLLALLIYLCQGLQSGAPQSRDARLFTAPAFDRALDSRERGGGTFAVAAGHRSGILLLGGEQGGIGDQKLPPNGGWDAAQRGGEIFETAAAPLLESSSQLRGLLI